MPENPPEPSTDSLTRRAASILAGVMVAYVALVASHQGEFWPFSIYPMFSQAPDRSHQVLVRDITNEDGPPAWRDTVLEDLPGLPFGVSSVGIDAVDLAKYVRLTTYAEDGWTDARRAGIYDMFEHAREDRRLLVMESFGELHDGSGMVFVVRPTIVIDRDGTQRPPAAATTDDQEGAQ